jgi:hypothetical protein
MQYFKGLTPVQIALRNEGVRIQDAKRKALCEQVMAKYDGKKRKKK